MEEMNDARRTDPPDVTDRPKLIILAGPNGAGKTTFAREYLIHEAHCSVFINADLIAGGLSPFAPDREALRAGRIMLDMFADAVRRRESFAFETTLAGRSYARAIPKWRSKGYIIALVFLSLPSAEFAIARVAERVRQGGHNVPQETIRRRFAAGLRNFEQTYKPIVDTWSLYDGSGQRPILLEKGANS